MACPPEEIERKRKLALEKLQARKLQRLSEKITENTPALPKNNTFPTVSPVKDFLNNNGKGIVQNSPNTSTTNKQRAMPISNRVFYDDYNVNICTGTCYLISENRFEICLNGFSASAIEVFKTMKTRRYSPETKMWNFGLEEYEALYGKICQLKTVVVGKIPNYVLNLCRRKTPNYSEIDLTKIEINLRDTLMPFQREGVCFGISNGGRCLIADDMGLGKTFQALALASYYREDWPLLIATTSSMRNTWEETILKYIPTVPMAYVQYVITTRDYIGDAQILIISHDMMTRCTEKLVQKKFGVVIFDESHILKNFKAKCTKAAVTLSKIAKRIVLLSGTPALSRPSELYSQLSLIDDKFFGGFMEYSKRYCAGKTTAFGWDASGKSNLQELEIVLSKKFMIRRTKSDVLHCLPGKYREVIKLDVDLKHLPPKERLCFQVLIDNFHTKKAQEKHSALLILFSDTARIKAPAVCLYIEQKLKEDKKFLVFAHHQVMMDAICDVLNRNSKKFIRIDGSTNPDQRKYFINKFQTDDTYKCAVLSTMAANAGITLTAADLVIFAELHWNPSILTQAESRAHRIGQLKEVKVQYLLADGTADDHIWPLLLSKQDVLKEVGLNKDSFKDSTVTNQIEFSPKLQKTRMKLIEEYFINEKPEEENVEEKNEEEKNEETENKITYAKSDILDSDDVESVETLNEEKKDDEDSEEALRKFLDDDEDDDFFLNADF